MKSISKERNLAALIVQIVLTIAICLGMAFSSVVGLAAESRNLADEVVADYQTLTNDYIRSFKILRMEAVAKINEDLSFDEMLDWLQSKDAEFRDAIGADIYDGFAFTYKGGYAHSWNYGDYSNYDPNTRPWYQTAQAADGEIAVVAPYTTFLSGTAYIERYDTLRMSIAQRYDDDISFDFDLTVNEINGLISGRSTIYDGTVAFMYDENGYILSSTNEEYYGHNINTEDTLVSQDLSSALQSFASGTSGLTFQIIDNTPRVVYSLTDEDNKTVCLLIPFMEVFQRNLLFVLLLACVLLAIEIVFFRRNNYHMHELEAGRDALKDALSRAESASSAKGDFLSRMSHEIRTPLNAIIGYLDIAKDEHDDPEKVAHCLDQSSIASRHLLSIINDVLDISSIESGRMKIAHDEFDLTQLIRSLTTMFYGQTRDKGVNFDVSVLGLTEERVIGDSLRVNQVLMNLLSNAVKFTDEGGSVKLSVEQKSVNGGKVHLQFRVADTGIGMSEEYRSRMFRPFEQEKASTARSYGGTGLGLSISNNLVKMMGGNIEVESKQGSGTTFTIMLAFDQVTSADSASAAPVNFSHLRALVVDDEESACEYIHRLLERCNIKNDAVTSGKKAIRRVKSHLEEGHPYDFCIIDWNMSEMDGLETARQIRETCNDDMPIIIATSYDYSSIVDEARQVGVSKIVSKPLFQSSLFDLLVNTFGKYEPAAAKEGEQVDFNGMHVLLAEDNEMNMEIALNILNKAGLKVTPATNGKEALETFCASEPGTFDAVLMDVQMPVMDGYEATREIRRSSHAQAKEIPIVAMTANAFTSDVNAALAAGMNDHVAKPISYTRLFEVLSNLVAKEA